MVALGRGTTPVDAVPLSGTPGAVTALPEHLVALGDLPGARYVLVLDASGDHVRGELGGPPDADLAVLAWARRIADVSRERGRAMEDVVLTTESAHHLVRTVPGVGEDVWVVLRIDREQGNLALARRALAGAGTGRARALPAATSRASEPAPGAPAPAGSPVAPSGRVERRRSPARPVSDGPATGSLPVAMPSAGTPVSLAPAPRRADNDLPRPAARPGSDVPALAFLPTHRPTTPAPPPVVRPALLVPEEVPPPPATPAPRTSGAVRTPDVSDEPSLPDEVPSASGAVRTPDVSDEPSLPDEVPGTSGAVRTPDVSDVPSLPDEAAPEQDRSGTEPGMWDPRRRPLTVRQARTWRTAPEVPAAREPAEPAASAPEIPAPRTGSLFAPVVVVPPPPSPVDDDTTEVPAPVPYPIITAPPLEPAPEPVPAAPGPASEEEQAATDAGLPRRSPGAHLRSPTPAPEAAPAAAALSTGLPRWSTEPSVLRRLLLGLRRLT